ncbi:hypothetical protein BCR32DRAFT_287503 [Anaeromyces robustus]|uniref:Uncharacterized protein n=1 Tax=Anaeromyces robustus TaxID=1754192 RepID=A0A1Y1VRB1_9FUNG|nr:hypothetical protein BCR32DRAFT_287503 [Anaeromyces robustus]|eukprot:ORX63842.1 hypothetical protein BCR32DRAFT_287503 [Anaeromyces robustus]
MNNFPNQKGKSRIRTSDIYDKVSEIKDQWREIANEKKNRSVIKIIQKTLKY